MATTYVRFDEKEDAVAALELVADLCWDLKDNPSLWKWMVMGIHNAMQAAMVLSLAGTDGCGALRDKSAERNRMWLQKPEGLQPPVIMADYKTLLYRVQLAELVDGSPLALSPEEWEKLERLNELRRTFAHFNPQGWSIELALLLDLMPIALNAIEHLLTTQPRVLAQLTDAQRARIAEFLEETRQALGQFNKETDEETNEAGN